MIQTWNIPLPDPLSTLSLFRNLSERAQVTSQMVYLNRMNDIRTHEEQRNQYFQIYIWGVLTTSASQVHPHSELWLIPFYYTSTLHITTMISCTFFDIFIVEGSISLWKLIWNIIILDTFSPDFHLPIYTNVQTIKCGLKSDINTSRLFKMKTV